MFTQALAHLAGDFVGFGEQFIQRAVLPQPLCCGLGADFRNARNVVSAIAHECEVVDDLLGPDVELRFHARAVHDAAAHGVDKRDAVVDELRHVLVAGGHAYLQPLCAGGASERADDIVRFHTTDAQQR